jgi:hypothetical protein
LLSISQALFAVELAVSFVAHAFFLFFMDAWRIFDTCIVGIGIMSSSGPEIPAVNAIRAIRVLRAVRLLKKSKSLKPIVEALFSSIGPVLNSMVLLVRTSQYPDLLNTDLTAEEFLQGLITCIYASMAVSLFGEQVPVKFGWLSQSLFTMFQCCTGDGWSSDVARPLFHEDGTVAPLPALFFVSYMLVVFV